MKWCLKGGFQLMQILGLLGMYFDAVVFSRSWEVFTFFQIGSGHTLPWFGIGSTNRPKYGEDSYPNMLRRIPDRVAVATLSGIKLTQGWRKHLKVWLGHNIYIKIVPGCHFHEEKTLETKQEENQKLPNNVWERSQVVPPPLQCY